MNNVDYGFLKQKQSLSLENKITLSKRRIREFYEHSKVNGNIYVAFSGGKDSTVLLNLVRSVYPDTTGVFCDTGLEYPEIRDFVKTIDNVTLIRPEMNFKKVLETYGYPVISKQISYMIRQCRNPNALKSRHYYLTGEKNFGKDGKSTAFILPKKWRYLINAPFKISEQCCNVMKKKPFHKYHKKTGSYPFIGLKADDSKSRQALYLKNGCNAFEFTVQSNPLGFWLESDILEYIKKYDLKISDIYNKGMDRTGCMFCMFGIHMEKESRFGILKRLHPKLYNYCMNDLGLKEVLEYLKIPDNKTTVDKYIRDDE